MQHKLVEGPKQIHRKRHILSIFQQYPEENKTNITQEMSNRIHDIKLPIIISHSKNTKYDPSSLIFLSNYIVNQCIQAVIFTTKNSVFIVKLTG